MEKIKELLRNNNINFMVSVDDCYKQVVTIEGKSALIDDIVDSIEKYKFFFSSVNELTLFDEIKDFEKPIKRKFIQQFIEELSDVNLERAYHLVDQINKDLISEKDTLLDFLNESKKLDIIKDYRTFDNVHSALIFLESEVNKLWNPNESNRILWLVDRDFSHSGGTVNEGLILFDHFLKSTSKWNMGILATRNISDIETEEQLSEFLTENFSNLYDNQNLIWGIDKTLIDKSRDDEFVQKISHGLKRNYTYKITDLLTLIFKEGLDLASTKFKNIAQSTVNQMIFNYSNTEGVSIIETLSRVLLVYTKFDYNQKLKSKFNDVSKLIWEYERLPDIKLGTIRGDSREVNIIRNIEKYNTFVNDMYYPIGFGDIFNINGKEYLLISQTCDIVLRGSGERKIQKGILLRLSNVKPKSGDEGNGKSYFELKYYKEGQPHYVLFKEVIQLELNVLDLCALNDNGVADIAIDELNHIFENDYRFSVGLRYRLKFIVNKIKETYEKKGTVEKAFVDLASSIESVTAEKKHEIQGLLERYKQLNNSIQNENLQSENFQVLDGKIEYNVRRICRLEELVTLCLCLEYNSHNSRIGLPFDFAEGFEPKKYNVLFENPLFSTDSTVDEKLSLVSEYLIHQSDDLYMRIINELIIDECGVTKVDDITSSFDDAKIHRYIEMNERTQEVIIKSEVFPIEIEGSGLYCKIVSNKIKIPIVVFQEHCKNLFILLEKSKNNESDFFRRNRTVNKFFIYSEGKRVFNETVTFDEPRSVTEIIIETQIVATIKLKIIQTEMFKYKLEIEIQENVEVISSLL
jgi:hypothetical protein